MCRRQPAGLTNGSRAALVDGLFEIRPGMALHIHCEGSGSPTVLFEAGLGASGVAWWESRPRYPFTRACVIQSTFGTNPDQPARQHQVEPEEEHAEPALLELVDHELHVRVEVGSEQACGSSPSAIGPGRSRG